jgi:hypothetical protein
MAGGARAGQHLLLALTAFALNACASSTPEKSAEAVPPTAKPSAVAAATVSSDPLPRLPKATEAPKAEPAREKSAPAAKVATATISPAEGMKRLVGLDRTALESTLGIPWLMRREAKAELWQYRAPNCVLDLFLYAKADGELRVMHADLRGRRENRPAPAGCFAEIVGGQTQKADASKPTS